MANHATALQHQFDDLEQQEESATLGMWIFLATEVLLFGGLFLGYTVYRTLYPEAWVEGSHHNNLLIGTINTAVLIVSSLTMALAVHASEEGRWKLVPRFLVATIALGLTFLVLKFVEYYQHWVHHLVPGLHFELAGPLAQHVEMFMVFYFFMTLLHALHMTIGVGLVSYMAIQAHRRKLPYHMPIEITGLYWHLIDIIWVFLYPLLYLVA